MVINKVGNIFEKISKTRTLEIIDILKGMIYNLT